MTLKVVTGHDSTGTVADVEDLANGIPEPRIAYVRYPQRLLTLGLGMVERGYLLADWEFEDVLGLTPMQTLLTQLGLRSGTTESLYSDITAYQASPTRELRYYNARVYHPRPRWLAGRWVAHVFRVVLTEDITP